MSKAAKVGASIVVTAILVWLLLQHIDAHSVLNAVRGANLAWAAIAFLLYTICYLFRTVRFQVLLQHKLTLKELFSITALHNLFTNLLPFRSGEFSYPYMLRRKVGLGESLTTLVLARMFDFMAVAMAFLITMAFLPALPSLIIGTIWTISIFLVVLIALSLLALFASAALIEFFQRLIPKSLRQHRAGKWVGKKLREIALATKSLRGRALVNVGSYSLGIWIFQFLTYAALLHSVGLNMSFISVVVTVSLVSLASAIPIQGLAGIGTTEAYWSAVLIALGAEKSTAIAAAFAQHFYVITFYLALGAVGYALSFYRKR